MATNVTDSLVVGMISTETVEVFPLLPKEHGLVSLYETVYESLVFVDEQGFPQPYLCETWSEAGNGDTWRFTLKKDIFFSDGTPLTAHDVVASGNYILELAETPDIPDNGFYSNMKYIVESFEALDDLTLEVNAKRPYYGVLYAMTFPVIKASQLYTPSPLGSGPYKISEFFPLDSMYLSVNEKWWQNAPKVQEITAVFFPNNDELISAYEFGQLDTVFTRSISSSQYKSGISSLSLPYETRQLETLLINHRSFPLESLNIRQALRYAIDVEKISKNVYMNMTTYSNTPIPSTSWLYLDESKDYTYNPEKAKELLEKEGWYDSDNNNVLDKAVGEAVKNFQLQLYVYEDPINDIRFETANLIAEMLGELKIKVVVTEMSNSDVAYQLEENAFDLVLCSFEMDVVPDVGFFLRKGNEQNYGRYNSENMNNAIDELRQSYRPEDFLFQSQLIQQQFTQDIPFICLFYRRGAVLTRKMYSAKRILREYSLLDGIESFNIE